MINIPVGIINNASIGGGQYTFDLYFQDNLQAKYLNVGDTIEANNGDRYSVDTWVGFPNDFISSAQVTATFIDNDVLAPNDTGFNSLAYTPNQIDFRPQLQVTGSIGLITTFSGQAYEYNISATWTDNLSANLAVVGDKIFDVNGKEFEISFLDVAKFNDPFRVVEVEKVGLPPVAGDAGLYRSTTNFGLSQNPTGDDFQRNNIINRDKIKIDLNLGSGNSSNGEWTRVVHTITAGEETAKSFTFAPIPLDSNEVMVRISSAPTQIAATDFSIAGTTFSWGGLALDGILGENDLVELFYFS